MLSLCNAEFGLTPDVNAPRNFPLELSTYHGMPAACVGHDELEIDDGSMLAVVLLAVDTLLNNELGLLV